MNSTNPFIQWGQSGTQADVDSLMAALGQESTIAGTKIIDYALSLVETPAGIARIEHYLFHGSQRQRNFSSLYFNRKDEWDIVKKAFQMGLIDERQAFSR